MASSSTDFIVRTRYAFTLDGSVLQQPLENITLRITDCGASVCDAEPDVDLGNVAIIPELVNTHTHLEFSSIASPLDRTPEATFADWITKLLESRAQRDLDPNAHRESVELGLRESAQHGIGVLGEIATQCDWVAGFKESDSDLKMVFRRRPARGIRFLELLGLSPDRIENLLTTAKAFLQGATPPRWRAGLSPHAPYTVGWKLMESIPALSRQFRAPVAMHLSETIEEMELLSSHCGPLVELLRERGVWDPTAVPRGIQPLDYLEQLAQAHRSLIIHGNYLMPVDWKLLARHSSHMSVVYCPRTFDYFGHEDYPLRKMIDAGVLVAVGTDSRASNPDLDLFKELQFIRQRHADVSSREILLLGTENGAQALGETQLGLRTVELADEELESPFDLLFHADPDSYTTKSDT